MQKAKISIIVPVYNTARFLPKCLESLQEQTHEALQIILVNDGSTDDSLAICHTFAQADPRITVIDQINGGVASARNAALALARGDYIGFVDSDDYVASQMFEKLLQALLETGADLAECAYQRVDDQGRATKDYGLKPMVLEGSLACSESFIRKANAYYVACNKLYRASLIEGLTFPPLRYSEDFLFNVHALGRCQKRVSLETVFYYYLDNQESATNQLFVEAKLDVIEAGRQAFSYYQETFPQLCPYAAYYIINNARFLHEGLRTRGVSALTEDANYLIENYKYYFEMIQDELPRIVSSSKRRMALRLFNRSRRIYYAARCIDRGFQA